MGCVVWITILFDDNCDFNDHYCLYSSTLLIFRFLKFVRISQTTHHHSTHFHATETRTFICTITFSQGPHAPEKVRDGCEYGSVS